MTIAKEGGILLLVLLAGLLYALFAIDFSTPPFEDAAILMRYAQHLGSGLGLVWNPGEPPVDGATDFLFVVAVGGLFACGVPLEMAVKALCLLAHFGGTMLIFVLLRRQKVSLLWVGLIALYFVMGRGLYLSAAYFGTSFFALFVGLSWGFAMQIILRQGNAYSPWLFGFFALLAGLTRPEGVLLTALMLLSIVLSVPAGERKSSLLAYATMMGSLGSLYFAWHWYYFGYPLPNPFYVKGGGTIYLYSLKASVLHVAALCFPFVPIYLFSFLQNPGRTLVRCLPLIGGAGMWLLLSDDMNYAGRFQYPLLIIASIAWVGLWRPETFSRTLPAWVKHPIWWAMLGLIVLLLQHQRLSDRLRHGADGRMAVANILAEYSSKNYQLATTEAGLLPLYSGWPSLDCWGLNDAQIAHHPPITQAYLASWAPELILFHGDLAEPLLQLPSPHSEPWRQMIDTLKTFTQHHPYTLAAAYGESPMYVHFYYVRDDFPEAKRLIEQIRSVPYRWFQSDQLCQDYRLLLPNP